MLRRRGGFLLSASSFGSARPQFKAKAHEKFAHPPRVFSFPGCI
jgi:hypothetical protein